MWRMLSMPGEFVTGFYILDVQKLFENLKKFVLYLSRCCKSIIIINQTPCILYNF